MIRQRRGSNLAEDDNDNEPSTPRRPAEKKNETTTRTSQQLCTLRRASLHLLSVLLLIVSVIVAQTRLKSHEECDMTYSRRHFVELSHHFSNNNDNHHYRVFQFTDERDPRRRADPTNWCGSLPLILYVPGHGGSYEQSRSLGAHGLQLTRRRETQQHERTIAQKLLRFNHNNHTTTTTKMDDFFYDVIALDFREEGGGFHGAIIERQAAFLANTVLQITQTCNIQDLTIVAHSIGGISTRWALHQYPLEMATVHTVLTLGTPHAHPVLSWESQLHRIYRELYSSSSSSNKVTLVSISGGLRDEMIPPMACLLDSNNNDGDKDANELTLLATDLMPRGTVEAQHVAVALGMDHRAVVWCHNLLTPVRQILYALLQTTNHGENKKNAAAESSSADSRITRVLQQLNLPLLQQLDKNSTNGNEKNNVVHNYRVAVGGIRPSLQETQGYWMGWAMETGLLYNTEILVHAFVCIGSFRYLQPHWMNTAGGSSKGSRSRTRRFLWLPALSLGVLQYYTILRFHASMDPLIAPRFSTVLVQSLVADAVFLTLQWILNRFLGSRANCGESKSRLGAAVEHMTNIWIWVPLLSILLLLEATMGNVLLFGHASKGILCALSLVFAYIFGLAAIAKLAPKDFMDGDSGKDSKSCWIEQQVNFAVWVMVLLPIVALGDVVVFVKGLTATWVIPAVTLVLGVRFWFVVRTHSLLCNSRVSVDEMIWTRQSFWFQAATLAYACWAVLSCNVQSDPTAVLGSFHPLALPFLLASMMAIVSETSFYVKYNAS